MRLLPHWLSGLINSNSIEREVDEELRFHLELLTEEYVARGISRAEAEGFAARRFGNLQQIKLKCAQIANRNRSSIRVIKALLVVLLLSGISIRFVAVELAVKHIGEILVAIAILTRVLFYVRGLKPAKVSDTALN
jgi:hypothetical protein